MRVVATLGKTVFLFRKAREAGFRPFIDHDLSKRVAHIGSDELWFDSIPETATDLGAAEG